jgi:hypothetical protein
MKGRLFLIAGVWVVILVTALAQPAAPQPAPAAPEAAPTPTPGPTPPDEARPTRVLTPTPDRQLEEAGQPLTPLGPGPQPEPETTIQPEERPVEPETVGTEEAIDIDELGRRRWRVIPIFSVRGEYNDNIFGSETDRVSDFIGSTTFGFIFELGDFRQHDENYLGLSWAGQPVIYAQNSGQNAFNQYAAITLQYRFNKMVARWDGGFTMVKGQNRDVSTIVTMKWLYNRLAFSYDLSEKTQLNFRLLQSKIATEGFQGNDEYSATAGMNYQIFPKTTVGFEGVVGVIDSTDTPLEYYQQLRLQISYAPTQKVTITFNGGLQFLQFQGNDMSRTDPVFSLGVKYQPFPTTSIGLVAYRNVAGRSLQPGQDYFATGFELTVQQQFFQKFAAELSSGYENDKYFGVTPENPTERVDNYVYVRPRLTYAFVHWFSARIFYEFRRTSSNFPGSSFYNNIAGLEFIASY